MDTFEDLSHLLHYLLRLKLVFTAPPSTPRTLCLNWFPAVSIPNFFLYYQLPVLLSPPSLLTRKTQNLCIIKRERILYSSGAVSYRYGIIFF